jgi:RNA polymerase-binding transcription factor DksA
MHYHYFTLEQRSSLEQALRANLAGSALDDALGHLRSAAYGVCQTCGGDIPFRRLISDPLAQTCPNCS